MLRSVHYGPHTIAPWCPGRGYIDREARNSKSFRSREPRSVWHGLNPATEELGEYDLHICRHCFLYTSLAADLASHEKVCRYRSGHPGRLVYEDSRFRYYETKLTSKSDPAKSDPTKADSNKPDSSQSAKKAGANGTKGGAEPDKTEDPTESSLKLYLQCLSLLGHLFLDTKSICFSVDAFVFYTAVEKRTGFVAGFFSKEKHSWHNYNLACIVILPPWQEHGLGRRLIRLSYWMIHGGLKYGSPEKPLSVHGQRAYESYWRRQIAQYVARQQPDETRPPARQGRMRRTRAAAQHVKRPPPQLSLRDIAKGTKIHPNDVRDVMEKSGALSDDGRILVAKLVNRTSQPHIKPEDELQRHSS